MSISDLIRNDGGNIIKLRPYQEIRPSSKVFGGAGRHTIALDEYPAGNESLPLRAGNEVNLEEIYDKLESLQHLVSKSKSERREVAYTEVDPFSVVNEVERRLLINFMLSIGSVLPTVFGILFIYMAFLAIRAYSSDRLLDFTVSTFAAILMLTASLIAFRLRNALKGRFDA